MNALLIAVCVSLLSLILSQSIFLACLIAFILVLFSRKLNRLSFFIILIFALLRYEISLSPDFFDEGRVVELNQSSVLIQKGFSKILVLDVDVYSVSLGDIISISDFETFEKESNLFGFNLNNWATSNHIIGKAKYQKTLKKAALWLRFISYENADNLQFQEWYRHILFQVNHDSVLGSLFSLGLLYTSVLIFLDKLLSRFKYKEFLIFGLIFFLLYLLGQPISLLRICVFRLVRLLVKRKDWHFFISFIILYFIEPLALKQLAWALPLVMMAMSRFHKTNLKKLESTALLASVFLAFNIRFSLAFILFYSQLRKVFPILVLFLFLARSFVMLQIPFIDGMEWFNHNVELLKSFFYQSGHLSFITFILIMLIYQMNLSKVLFLLTLYLIVFVLNPIFILPLTNQIIMINVGQGDSFLFQSAFNQEIILLDTGNTYAYDHLKACLDYYGIKEIDVLSLTHMDSDHSANIEALMNDFNIKHIADYEETINYSTSKLIQINEGHYQNENDNSKVYYLMSDGIEFLFMADVSTFVEKQLIKQYPNLKVDVLKIGHHGSKTSTSLDFLHQIEADIALLSVGNNHYGHPNLSVIENLNNYHLKILNSKEDGDVILSFINQHIFIRSSFFEVYTVLSH